MPNRKGYSPEFCRACSFTPCREQPWTQKCLAQARPPNDPPTLAPNIVRSFTPRREHPQAIAGSSIFRQIYLLTIDVMYGLSSI